MEFAAVACIAPAFSDEKLEQNIRAFADAVIKAKPTGAKWNVRTY